MPPETAKTTEKDPVDPAADKARDDKGRFVTSSDPGFDFDGPPTEMDPDKDPFLSNLSPEEREAAGFRAEAPDQGDAGEKDDKDAKGTESDPESETDGDTDDGDDLLGEMVAAQARATEGDDDHGAESGSGRATEASKSGESEMEFVRRLAEVDEDLAVKALRAISGKRGNSAPPVAKGGLNRDALREKWKKAVAEGKDFDGVFEIAEAIAQDRLQPVLAQQERRAAFEKAARERIQEFEAFKQKFPGWHVHRARMSEVLGEIAKDSGPDAAARVKPETLLRLAAPAFAAESAKATAAKVAQDKKATATAKATPPKGAKAGGPVEKAALGKEQESIQRTASQIALERRLRNPW